MNSVSVCQESSSQACNNALSTLDLKAVIAYRPAGRCWAFQWAETGVFLAAALMLAGFCFWSIRQHRLSR